MLAGLLENIEFNIAPGVSPHVFLNGKPRIGFIISAILYYVFFAAGILLLIMLLAGGFQMMLAAGEPKKMESAKSKITNALIGFVIIFLAFWITQLVGKIFNISAFGEIFK